MGESAVLASVVMRRRLPVVAEPQAGESLSSWVDRTAAIYGIESRRVLWVALNLCTSADQQSPTGYGIGMTAARERALGQVSGIPTQTLRNFVLSRFTNSACPMDDIDLSNRLSIGHWLRRHWAYAASSHVCPSCVVADSNAWQLAWRLPWSFGCLRHSSFLLGVCPQCGRRFQSVTNDPRQSTRCCANVRERNTSAEHREDRLCGQPVASMCATGMQQPSQALQERLAQHLGSPDSTGFFADLRALTRLVQHLGTQTLLDGYDPCVLERMADHVQAREAQFSRARAVGAPPLSRLGGAVPDDPLLMCGSLAIAIQLLDSDTMDGAWRRLVDVVDQELVDPSARWNALRQHHVPERCARSLHAARARRRWSISFVGRARSDVRGDRGAARWVPALCWEDVYRRNFSDLLPTGRWQDAHRSFISAAVIRTLDPRLDSWFEAAQFLGKRIARRGNRPRSLVLIPPSRRPVLDQRVRSLAEAVRSLARPIDYAKRRSVFGEFTDLTTTDWADALRGIAVDPRVRLNRRRDAAVWVWSQATGGDWRHAPAFHPHCLFPGPAAAAKNSYVSLFIPAQLPRLEAGLIQVAEQYLTRATLDGPLTPSWAYLTGAS